MTMGPKDAGWDEYDAAAEDLARRGLRGDAGDALPFGLSARVLDAINADPEAFAERVRGFAYARSMNEAEPLAHCSGCGTELDGSYCPECEPPDMGDANTND